MSRPDCSCETCVKSCEHVPGWFSPRDVRRLFAAYGERARQFVAFDQWYGGFSDVGEEYKDVTVCIPPNEVAAPGAMYPEEPWFNFGPSPRFGRCALLVDGRCSIHAHKPAECRLTYGSKCEHKMQNPPSTLRKRIARAWARPAARRFLETLRGRGETARP